MNERIIIGLTGDSSKGKGSVSKILSEKGFDVFVLSDFIVEEARKMHWPHEDRKVLQNLGDNMRTRFGNDVLVQRTFQLDRFKMSDFIVIDGIRHPDEIELLKDVFPDSKVIGVDMTDETAFSRMKERNRSGDPTTIQEYKLLKLRERGEKGTSSMQVQECIDMADTVIWNEGSEEDLKKMTEQKLHDFGMEITTGDIEASRHHHHGHEHHN